MFILETPAGLRLHSRGIEHIAVVNERFTERVWRIANPAEHAENQYSAVWERWAVGPVEQNESLPGGALLMDLSKWAYELTF